MTDFKRPKKMLGQNFLQDTDFQTKIVHSLKEFDDIDTIIEIGPGRGALTEHLLKTGKNIIVIEFDSDLAQFWRNLDKPNLTVIESDVLKVNFNELITEKTRNAIIGNIPYNITSPIIFKILENKHLFEQSVLMIQKEVADRVVAKEGSKIFGILSIMVQTEAIAEDLFTVPSSAFYPVPKVDSSVISLDFKHFEPFDIKNKILFDKIVKTSFGQRRKMLRGSLKGILKALHYKGQTDLTRRPEQLSIHEFIQLVNEIDESKPLSNYG